MRSAPDSPSSPNERRRSSRRLGIGFLWLAAGLAGLLGAIGLMILWRTRPVRDGEWPLLGLTGPVRIERDRWGSPRLTAQNRLDAVRALGWLHAQDRFLQMDINRRLAAGELADLFGAGALSIDRQHRPHRCRARAEALYASLPATDKNLLEAYCAGVTAGLERLGGRPWEYWLLCARPKPWRPVDCLLTGYAMYFNLQNPGSPADWVRGRLRDRLTPAVFAFLFSNGSAWDAPLAGGPRPILPPPPMAEWPVDQTGGMKSPAVPDAAEATETGAPGSNQWAVEGWRMGGGPAWLANDMHLGLSQPGVWYFAALHYRRPGGQPVQVTGVTLPGLPLVVTGSNGHIAWGFTNSYADTQDWVEIVPAAGSPDRYLTANGPEEYRRFTEIVSVRGGRPERLSVRETRWGPVQPGEGGRLRVSQWVGNQAWALDMRLADLETAVAVEEALDIAAQSNLPAQNILVAGRSGQIGWTIAGALPARLDPSSAWSGALPLRSDDPNASWLGRRPPATYPRRTIFTEGWAATANNVVWTEPTQKPLGNGGQVEDGRAWQIAKRLRELPRPAPRDLAAIQLDTEVFFQRRWRDLLVAVLDGGVGSSILEARKWTALRQQLTVEAWRAGPDSVVHRLVREFRDEVRLRLTEKHLGLGEAAAGLDLKAVIREEPIYLLAREARWQPDLEAAARAIVTRMEAGGGVDDYRWGKRNRLTLHHPFGLMIRPLGWWLDIRDGEMPGDFCVPRVQGPNFGASVRFVVAPGRESEGLLQLPGGACGHPFSPYYSAGHDEWRTGQSRPFLGTGARDTMMLHP